MTVESVSPKSELRVLLEQLGDPCWVLDPTGRVRIANAAARKEAAPPAQALAAIARGEGDEIVDGLRIRRVRIDAEYWTLVIALTRDPPADTARLFGLDPNDAEIVDLLVAGFSDRELVLLTGRPIGPIHAAIVRIYRALGVSTRAELLASLKRARVADAALARNPTARSEAVPRGPSVLASRTGTSRRET